MFLFKNNYEYKKRRMYLFKERVKNKIKMVDWPLYSSILNEAVFLNLQKFVVFTDEPEINTFGDNQCGWANKVKPMKK